MMGACSTSYLSNKSFTMLSLPSKVQDGFVPFTVVQDIRALYHFYLPPRKDNIDSTNGWPLAEEWAQAKLCNNCFRQKTVVHAMPPTHEPGKIRAWFCFQDLAYSFKRMHSTFLSCLLRFSTFEHMALRAFVLKTYDPPFIMQTTIFKTSKLLH
jgi:hypothetical protein